MARTENFPSELSSQLPQLIGSRISQIVSGGVDDNLFPNLGAAFDQTDSNSVAMTLAESFPLWMLAFDVTDTSLSDLRQLAQPMGRWHHQIHLSNGKLAYARSAQTGTKSSPGEWKVREIVEGPLAEQIERAINLVDRTFPDEYEVRILSAPSYVLNAFWILNERTGDQHFLVLTPLELASGSTFLGKVEFLTFLRSMLPVEGLIDDFSTGASLPPATGNIASEVELRITIRRHSRYGKGPQQ